MWKVFMLVRRLLKEEALLEKCTQRVDTLSAADHFTDEEVEGLRDMDAMFRIFRRTSRAELERDIKHLKRLLEIE